MKFWPFKQHAYLVQNEAKIPYCGYPKPKTHVFAHVPYKLGCMFASLSFTPISGFTRLACMGLQSSCEPNEDLARNAM